MSGRSLPYCLKPPENWEELTKKLSETTFYLVSTSGPTCYTVRGEDSDQTFRVYIGDRQKCSCTKRAEVCIHLLYVMAKVLRVALTDPVVWQLSLLDTEISNILDYRERQTEQRRKKHDYLKRNLAAKGSKSVENEEGEVTAHRHELDPDEVCPICQEEMTAEEDLSWCRKGCGTNVHSKCMQMFASHGRSTCSKVTCPLCRTEWGPVISEKIVQAKAAVQQPPYVPICCRACKLNVISIFYRCLLCTDKGPFDLCRRCYGIPKSFCNPRHPFIQAQANVTVTIWETAPPPVGVPVLAPDFISQLQGRELTTADYAILLQLDKPAGRSLHEQLLQALPIIQAQPRTESQEWKCPAGHSLQAPCDSGLFDCDVCNRTSMRRTPESLVCLVCDYDVCANCKTRGSKNADSQAVQAIFERVVSSKSRAVVSLTEEECAEELARPCSYCTGKLNLPNSRPRKLPCGHGAHESCVVAAILEFIGQQMLEQCCCPLDEQALFPALHRRRQRPKEKRVGENAVPVSNETKMQAGSSRTGGCPKGHQRRSSSAENTDATVAEANFGLFGHGIGVSTQKQGQESNSTMTLNISKSSAAKENIAKKSGASASHQADSLDIVSSLVSEKKARSSGGEFEVKGLVCEPKTHSNDTCLSYRTGRARGRVQVPRHPRPGKLSSNHPAMDENKKMQQELEFQTFLTGASMPVHRNDTPRGARQSQSADSSLGLQSHRSEAKETRPNSLASKFKPENSRSVSNISKRNPESLRKKWFPNAVETHVSEYDTLL